MFPKTNIKLVSDKVILKAVNNTATRNNQWDMVTNFSLYLQSLSKAKTFTFGCQHFQIPFVEIKGNDMQYKHPPSCTSGCCKIR